MKSFKQFVSEDVYEDDDEDAEIDYSDLASVQDVRALIPLLVEAAQHTYDEWDEEDIDTYAGGGICHLIADEFSDILNSHGINCCTVSSTFEQHVYCTIQVREGIYNVDVPYSYYETGGGFSWHKRPDIQFDESFIVIDRLSSDPSEFDAYTDEG
jgi:hypothetical protein